MRKKLLLILMAVLAVVGLAACKRTEDKPTPGEGDVIDFSQTLGKKVEITVWLDDEGGEYAKALIEAFNQTPEGKDITVIFRHEGTVESRDRLKTYGPTGGGADVFQFPHDHIAPAILEDLVFALPESTRELVESRSHEIGAQIAKAQYDDTTNTYGPGSEAVERLFAMPTSVESVGLYYNKKLISEEDVPKTMEDLIAKAEVWNQQLLDDGSGRTNLEAGRPYFTTSSHWADSYFMQGFYSAHGYQPFGETLDDKNNVGFESDEMKSALTWFRDELKPIVSGTASETDGQGGNFEAGLIPLIIAGPWNIEAYLKASDVIDLGVAPMPTIAGKASNTYAGAIMTAVYKYSKNRNAAVKFVEFLNSDKAMELLYKHKGKLPALKPELLSNIQGVSQDKLLMAMSEQLKTSIPMPTIPEVQHYWGPGENMLKALWADGDIDAITREAQESYEALAKIN